MKLNKNIKNNFFIRLFKNTKKELFIIPDYIVFNIENFNNWFNDPNKESYAGSGIFLRIDKLGISFIENYLKDCYDYDIELYEYLKIVQFYDDIVKDWKFKLKKSWE